MAGIGNVDNAQAQMGYQSAALGNVQNEGASEKMQISKEKRTELQQKMKEQQERIAELQAELGVATDEASSAWGVFKSFFGSDSGVGELSDELQSTSADLKLSMREVEMQQAQMEAMMAELQKAQGEMSGKLKEDRQTRDEEMKVVENIGSEG